MLRECYSAAGPTWSARKSGEGVEVFPYVVGHVTVCTKSERKLLLLQGESVVCPEPGPCAHVVTAACSAKRDLQYHTCCFQRLSAGGKLQEDLATKSTWL